MLAVPLSSKFNIATKKAHFILRFLTYYEDEQGFPVWCSCQLRNARSYSPSLLQTLQVPAITAVCELQQADMPKGKKNPTDRQWAEELYYIVRKE